MLLLGIRDYRKSALRYKFLILDVIRTLSMSVHKNVRFRDYFSKPKSACEQKRLGNTDLVSFHVSVGRAGTEETTQCLGYQSSLCRPMHRVSKLFRSRWLTSHPINYTKIGDIL